MAIFHFFHNFDIVMVNNKNNPSQHEQVHPNQNLGGT